jgi:hypothetical protein
LDLSLFERLVTLREKEFGKKAMQNGSLATLTTQRRMRPEIANLIRVTLYPKLLDAEAVQHYPDVRGKILKFIERDREVERDRDRER